MKETPLNNIFLWAAQKKKKRFCHYILFLLLCHKAFLTPALSLRWWSPVIWQKRHVKRASLGISNPHFHRNIIKYSKGNSFFPVTSLTDKLQWMQELAWLWARFFSVMICLIFTLDVFWSTSDYNQSQTSFQILSWRELEIARKWCQARLVIKTDTNNMLCVKCCFSVFIYILFAVVSSVIAVCLSFILQWHIWGRMKFRRTC